MEVPDDSMEGTFGRGVKVESWLFLTQEETMGMKED